MLVETLECIARCDEHGRPKGLPPAQAGASEAHRMAIRSASSFTEPATETWGDHRRASVLSSLREPHGLTPAVGNEGLRRCRREATFEGGAEWHQRSEGSAVQAGKWLSAEGSPRPKRKDRRQAAFPGMSDDRKVVWHVHRV